MTAFCTAEHELGKTRQDALLDAISATDIAFAHFIANAETEWDEEEDFDYSTPRDLLPENLRRHNRLEDFRDGRLATPTRLDYVESAFLRVATELKETDPAAARRLACLAATWSQDRQRYETDPHWARKNGIIPGSETAPSMAAILAQFGQREESRDAKRACALRMAAIAYRQLHTAASAYANACCAEFVYASAIGELSA